MMSVIAINMSLEIDELNGEVILSQRDEKPFENGGWNNKKFVEVESQELSISITCDDNARMVMSAHHVPGNDGRFYNSYIGVDLSVSDLRALHRLVSCVLEHC